MHFSGWPGFVVKTVAITFQIMKKRWLSQSCSYQESGRITDSIILVPVEVGLILRLDKCTWQLSPDQDGINPHFPFSQLF